LGTKPTFSIAHTEFCVTILPSHEVRKHVSTAD
jgi:hypothetical protein